MSNNLPAGYITEHFSLAELTRSNTAVRENINNTPHDIALQNLKASAKNLWQPVRELLNAPVLVSSGYRSERLNNRIGGAKNSAHKYGLAIDFIAPRFGNTRKIAKFLVAELTARNIKFDQIILEFPDSAGSRCMAFYYIKH
ncbi:D-Ala-D-Ala carboxypeptidase family metallohydrolase [Moraxella bovis]|uniref:D-Ala-D-Ala carboxypeptidase family metallohydrolase n=1 Tax=Moraxella bovis TaxID=476 RepID=UPI000DC7E05F|nr:D-Ala-D-Ala carboxypeptidase family metallohydrolase [Moraxella bovis]AWY19542.1 peptidase M15 [Moraxella bovis]